ncbi:ATP-dependent DNA helicase RecQ [Cyclobacterium xiamenense]|uniref:DNA 3'-5' helicase n=1 Tax=Cyclobacterium xiamenense TaxID=1297121 RepID=A0A1H6VZK3_9BACT|nr:RecQ family ATP-dependent DNA helicase [Cyclobacterium xiamenense]SEJ05465.1 ATP-dependent DNA helicase RecQ [Cyclobacterium xiamenense]
METITFIDAEIDPVSHTIFDMAAVSDKGTFYRDRSISGFLYFIENSRFICGHNIFNHDIAFFKKAGHLSWLSDDRVIDTLYFSPLLFPSRPYHALLKDDKLQTDELNNPLNDARKAKDLFFDEVAAFQKLDPEMQALYFLLLGKQRYFSAFFRYISYESKPNSTENLIRQVYASKICENSQLSQLISEQPVELAYCLALIGAADKFSITPPWVNKNYPEVQRLLFLLRGKPCLEGCSYCEQSLDSHRALKHYFGYDSYRTFGGEALQEKAVQAAIDNKSILAVFPTGGGKSITFQVPALMSGESTKGLTVVISPLQSLMKDQVDNLEKSGITEVATINGLLDPIERANSFERVEDGSVSLLYISPESLRSKSIERLLLGRTIARFVIDEAHCFSSWGQDFRVDYLYIGDFINNLQNKKQLEDAIPVSCFTATARQQVIRDIRAYFREKLSLELILFQSLSSRTNLHYKVYPKRSEEEKYQTLRDLLEEKQCPTIVYVSRTRKANLLADRLDRDGFPARPYHGKMPKNEKTENQDAFIRGDVSIMVATSAFGMGVDKKDVGMVVHFDISDSLENYVQEAGRAGRDEQITADCYVLFDEDDLSKHFILLNQTKLSIKEIQQIWKAIKDITRFRSVASQSALEIARKAGWDDNIIELETRVTTAIAALEEAGYLKRGQNMPRIFANSILSKNANEAIEKIHASNKFLEKEKEGGVRIIKKLFSSKTRSEASDEVGESRIDYISDHLGMVREEVINIINLLREENILADAKDLKAYLRKGANKTRSLEILESYGKLENFLLTAIGETERTVHLKALNEEAENSGCTDASPQKIKTIFNFWAIKNWIKKKQHYTSKNHLAVVCMLHREALKSKLELRHELSRFVIGYLFDKTSQVRDTASIQAQEILVDFSVQELKTQFETAPGLFRREASSQEVEDALFFLSRIEAIKIEGGFLVVYNRLNIERLEQDNKRRYKVEDYQKLQHFYENKVQQIHIVGEYANRMISDYKDALQFVEDYFHLNYAAFLQKYFKGSRQNEIKRNITPAKFRQLFGELSPTQLRIINDHKNQYLAVTAGPGSGKTRVLVHKLASLVLMEDIKYEQLLMLTFSRAAATEFKKRLFGLLGNAAGYIAIKTFHSYCFDLLGKVGNLEKSEQILPMTVQKIRNGEVEPSWISKAVLVIDEAQDMDGDEFALIQALMEENEEMRVIAVGDDDQNIFEFRGASGKYLEQFISDKKAVQYELVENYRSRPNLVAFANGFAGTIKTRLKQTPILATQTEAGKIELVRYHSDQLVIPLVQRIIQAGLSGSTCVLTRTNEESLQVAGLLTKNGFPCRLIQSNEGFNLLQLYEIRSFLSLLYGGEAVVLIDDQTWAEARRKWEVKFRSSSKFIPISQLLTDFERSHPVKKYLSDLLVFVRESKLEDFYADYGDTVLVSTIHKAKGKEFDNVYVLLPNFTPKTDPEKRLLYVALTRAKNFLSIHLNRPFLDTIAAEGVERKTDHRVYTAPTELAMQLSFKDVWLDFFMRRQGLLENLQSGASLKVDGQRCVTEDGKTVLTFSKQFLKQLEHLAKKGYQLKAARVNHQVYWQKEGMKDETLIILPELRFELLPTA